MTPERKAGLLRWSKRVDGEEPRCGVLRDALGELLDALGEADARADALRLRCSSLMGAAVRLLNAANECAAVEDDEEVWLSPRSERLIAAQDRACRAADALGAVVHGDTNDRNVCASETPCRALLAEREIVTQQAACIGSLRAAVDEAERERDRAEVQISDCERWKAQAGIEKDRADHLRDVLVEAWRALVHYSRRTEPEECTCCIMGPLNRLREVAPGLRAEAEAACKEKP